MASWIQNNSTLDLTPHYWLHRIKEVAVRIWEYKRSKDTHSRQNTDRNVYSKHLEMFIQNILTQPFTNKNIGGLPNKIIYFKISFFGYFPLVIPNSSDSSGSSSEISNFCGVEGKTGYRDAFYYKTLENNPSNLNHNSRTLAVHLSPPHPLPFNASSGIEVVYIVCQLADRLSTPTLTASQPICNSEQPKISPG